MTDQELHDYAADHLYYELWMLYEAGARLVHDPAVHTDWVLKNALIESFAIHARSLTIFLYPENSPKYATDVTSFDYVRDVQPWRSARGPIVPELKQVKDRTAKQIAHLTTERHPPGSPEKVWSPEPIVRAFFEPLRLFMAHVPAGRLDVSVLAFLANFVPTPSEGRAPAGPVSPTFLGGLGLAGSPSVPNTPVTPLTDVSTSSTKRQPR